PTRRAYSRACWGSGEGAERLGVRRASGGSPRRSCPGAVRATGTRRSWTSGRRSARLACHAAPHAPSGKAVRGEHGADPDSGQTRLSNQTGAAEVLRGQYGTLGGSHARVVRERHVLDAALEGRLGAEAADARCHSALGV